MYTSFFFMRSYYQVEYLSFLDMADMNAQVSNEFPMHMQTNQPSPYGT